MTWTGLQPSVSEMDLGAGKVCRVPFPWACESLNVGKGSRRGNSIPGETEPKPLATTRCSDRKWYNISFYWSPSFNQGVSLMFKMQKLRFHWSPLVSKVFFSAEQVRSQTIYSLSFASLSCLPLCSLLDHTQRWTSEPCFASMMSSLPSLSSSSSPPSPLSSHQDHVKQHHSSYCCHRRHCHHTRTIIIQVSYHIMPYDITSHHIIWHDIILSHISYIISYYWSYHIISNHCEHDDHRHNPY